VVTPEPLVVGLRLEPDCALAEPELDVLQGRPSVPTRPEFTVGLVWTVPLALGLAGALGETRAAPPPLADPGGAPPPADCVTAKAALPSTTMVAIEMSEMRFMNELLQAPRRQPTLSPAARFLDRRRSPPAQCCRKFARLMNGRPSAQTH
jgi:hypothetical protein